MKTLLLIDIQNDFLPGGALAVADADAVVPVANKLQSQFSLVVATRDWHPADHGSFAANHPDRSPGDFVQLDGVTQQLWPVHCVEYTTGAEYAPELETARIAQVFFKGTDPNVDSYSGFFDNRHRKDTGLADYLREHDANPLYLAGLATDYCVKYTALDARELGFDTFVVLDACRGVELAEGDVARALDTMRGAGVEIIDSADLLGEKPADEEESA